MLSNATLLLC